jgi:O-antigen ligase
MMWVVVAAICVVAVWGLFNPFAGLLGLLAINVIQPGEIYPVLNTFRVERAVAILVLISLVLHHGRLVFPRITKLFLIFWATMFLSVLLAFWRTEAFMMALDFGKIVIYHLLIVNLVTTRQRFHTFLFVFVLLIGWFAGSSVYAYSHGEYYYAGEHLARAEGVTSSGGNPNELGLTLVSALPLVALLVLSGTSRDRLVGLAVAGMSVWAVIITGSRSSFLTMIALLAAFIFSKKKRLLFLPIAAALLALVWAVTPPEYKQRYTSGVETRNQDESYLNRKLAWEAGWAMWKDYPLTGVGAGNFPNADGAKYWPNADPSRRIWLNAHSLYLQLLAELGLFGVIAFGYFVFQLYRLNGQMSEGLARLDDAPKWLRLFPTACSLCLFVLLLDGYSSHDLYRSTWYMLAAMSACVSTMISEQAPIREPLKARFGRRRPIEAPSAVGAAQ